MACKSIDYEREPNDYEIDGMKWWNSHSPESRATMLKSPYVEDDPTAARCYEVFGRPGLRVRQLGRPGR